MDVITNSAVLVLGTLMLLFNKQIGEFSLRHLDWKPELFKRFWFPRLNMIILGLLLIWSSVTNLIGLVAIAN